MKNLLNRIGLAFLILSFLILNITEPASSKSIRNNLAQQDFNAAIQSGIDYLGTQINPDGGVRWVDDTSSMAASIRVIQALAASGFTQDSLSFESSQAPVDFVADNAKAWIYQEDSSSPGFSVARAGQMLTAIAAANENPTRFGLEELDLIHEINKSFDSSSGAYGTSTTENVMDHVWAMIGLAANNAAIPEQASTWLISAQADDGSWNDGYGSVLDTTPLGIMALASTRLQDAESPAVHTAIKFMKDNQQPAGGWQNEWDTTTNANTTAVMVQAIHLLGQDPADGSWGISEGNPASALLALQGADGAFGGDFANAFSTADAIIALAGRSITDLGYLEIASDSFDFLDAEQQPDGGWGSMGQTLDVLIAFQAAGWNPYTIAGNESTLQEYIGSNLDAFLVSGPDAVGKAMVGLASGGVTPNQVTDIDLAQRLQSYFDESIGAYGDPENTWHQAFAILGLHALGKEIPESTLSALLSLQQDDGGWEYSPGTGTSPDNTALALQALFASGYSDEDPVVSKAIDFFRSTQTTEGGWGNSSTTAYALMAIHALGQSRVDWVTENGKDPVSNLLSFQKPNGAFVFNWEFTDDNLMSTTSALMALFYGSYLIKGNAARPDSQAVIIVDTSEGTQYADCVEFGADSISGLELLESSDFIYGMQEGFIASIMGVANAEGETNYWSYWSWNGREWVFKNSSAADSQVLSGTIEAWYFTSWEVFPSYPPQIIPDIHQICGSKILKAYSAQPHLDYNDLFTVPVQSFQDPPQVQTMPAQETSTIVPDPGTRESPEKIKPTVLSGSTIDEDEEQALPLLPLIMIIGMGVLVAVVVLVILRKSRK